MAGALRKVLYDDGGAVDASPYDEDAQSYGEDPASSGGSPGALGAPSGGYLSPADAALAPDPDGNGALAQLAGKVIDPRDIPGALSQIKGQADQANAEKMRLIRNAQSRLAQFGQPDPRMQAQAWINGLGAETPGGSVAGSFGAAGAAQMAERIRQQNQGLGVARDLGTLDIAQGTTGEQGAALDWNMLKERLGIARQADQAAAYSQYRDQLVKQRAAADAANNARALQIAQEAAQERERVAAAADRTRREAIAAANQAREDAIAERKYQADQLAQQHADTLQQGRYQWRIEGGPDPNDPTKTVPGSWRFPTRGDDNEQPKFFPGATRLSGAGAAGTQPALLKEMDALVAQKIAPDAATAFRMLRSSTSDPATFQRLVQAEKRAILNQNDPTTGDPYTDTAAEALARQNVKDRAQLAQSWNGGAPVANTNTADNPGFKSNFPLPSGAQVIPPGFAKAFPNAGATAPAPALTPAAAAAPRATGAAPPRPASVPRGAKYSPGTRTWWWQENGVWKTAPGA